MNTNNTINDEKMHTLLLNKKELCYLRKSLFDIEKTLGSSFQEDGHCWDSLYKKVLELILNIDKENNE